MKKSIIFLVFSVFLLSIGTANAQNLSQLPHVKAFAKKVVISASGVKFTSSEKPIIQATKNGYTFHFESIRNISGEFSCACKTGGGCSIIQDSDTLTCSGETCCKVKIDIHIVTPAGTAQTPEGISLKNKTLSFSKRYKVKLVGKNEVSAVETLTGVKTTFYCAGCSVGNGNSGCSMEVTSTSAKCGGSSCCKLATVQTITGEKFATTMTK